MSRLCARATPTSTGFDCSGEHPADARCTLTRRRTSASVVVMPVAGGAGAGGAGGVGAGFGAGLGAGFGAGFGAGLRVGGGLWVAVAAGAAAGRGGVAPVRA